MTAVMKLLRGLTWETVPARFMVIRAWLDPRASLIR